MQSERNYKVENIKIILIFFVVFGHLLELMGGGIIYIRLYIHSICRCSFLLMGGV